jgi:KDO2-lipid IV(A) lauroyltransferase
MKYIAFIITTAILRLIALLPSRPLYILSDLVYSLLYKVFAYRKAITTKNLKNSFPEYSEKEIIVIRKKFYKHLADIILENAALQYYPKKRIQKMYIFENPELIEEYYDKGRHVILIAGHYGNWEWGAAFSYTWRHLIIGIYKQLKNKYFEESFKQARIKYGALAIPMGNIGKAFFEYANQGRPILLGMVGDQRPIKKHVQYWTNFLNQKTAVLTGSEKLAKKFNSVVVFMKIRKVKRGVYSGKIELITENPRETAENELTEIHTRILENQIREEPAYWLWSHDRWKYSYEEWLASK